MANLAGPSPYTRTQPRGQTRSFVVKNATTLYAGALVGLDQNGFLDRWSDTAGHRFIGVCTQTVTGNTSATPPVEAIVNVSGVTLVDVPIAGTFVQGDVRQRVYCSTDNPADFAKGQTSMVGAIGQAIRFKSSGVGDVKLYTPEEHDAVSARQRNTGNTYCLTIPVNLASIAGTGDVLTEVVIPHAFRLVRFDASVKVPVTTGGRAATLNLEIGTTDVTGGVLALTSANCTPLGAKITGTNITANSTGSANGLLSVEASAVTAFAEGQVILEIWIQNTDS
jgi:hypothetical protein